MQHRCRKIERRVRVLRREMRQIEPGANAADQHFQVASLRQRRETPPPGIDEQPLDDKVVERREEGVAGPQRQLTIASNVSIVIAAAENPVCCSISRMHVGLVTLTSVK